jgi:chemotaxis protein methyltransferase CheR
VTRPALKKTSLIEEVSALVTRITGVQLGLRQRVMVESRLKRRMADLGIGDESAYSRYLAAHQREETEALVSLLTTHHTFFFREMQHFQYLENGGLAALVAGLRRRGSTTLRVWSAACSRGQEAYSIAMFLTEHLPAFGSDLDFEILGTDVDRESVAIAQNGVFHKREIKSVPLAYLADHWAKGSGDIEHFVKAKRSLRTPCSFSVVNLLDGAAIAACGSFDLIFCRNVFIYFTSEQIAKIGQNLVARLHPAGLLTIGVSETLSGLSLPLRSVGPSIYMQAPPPRLAEAVSDARTAAPQPGGTFTAVTPPRPPLPAPLVRVLCVDDSPSVLAILKQVLQERHGFTVVGTAVNGADAVGKIATLKPDVVTLDIHMPEVNGLDYLRKNWSSAHAPVVMVSSVAREDASLALACLDAGASDYVEKPALANLQERGEELRLKLSCAARRRQRGKVPARLDKVFAETLPTEVRPGSVCIMIAGFGDRKALGSTLRELQASCRVPIAILTEGLGAATAAMAKELSLQMNGTPLAVADGRPPAPGQITLGDLASDWAPVVAGKRAADASILVFGDVTAAAAKLITAWPAGQVLLEDLPRATATPGYVSDLCPTTSFAYMARLFLCGRR